jgi:lysyl-tRNA synthetase class 1
VLQVPVLERNTKDGTIIFEDECGTKTETPVTGGQCKLQWKPDFGMRWAALDVDFEMYGKDHLVSAKLYSKICSIAGGRPPEQFMFELFLDEKGEKISKSKGNGLSLDEWLRYGPQESLSYYMYQSPRKAKKLYFDVIPKAVDEYLSFLGKYQEQEIDDQLKNPAWHIHNGNAPKPEAPLSFALLLNLASVCHAEEASILWGFVSRYSPGSTPENAPHLNELITHALHYYQDFIKPKKSYRQPTDKEQEALRTLATKLSTLAQGLNASDIQTEIFSVGKEHGYENLREWFQALYEILLGQSQGPRFGSFVALYGINETIALIEKVLNGENLAA